MRVLCRVALALLMTVPVLLVLVIVFALAGRRRASPARERDLPLLGARSHSWSSASPERGRSRGIPLELKSATPGGHYPGGAGASTF